jgi:DNA-binding NarL/FixJ family response regulator
MDATAPLAKALSDPEMTVLTLLGCGQSVPQIATFLAVTPRTVEGHKRRLYDKLGVGSQSHAVARAISLGLFDGLLGNDGLRRPAAEPGRSPLVVIHAPKGACLQQIARAMLGEGLPFVVTRRPEAGMSHWARWHRGPLLAVLVDPVAGAWLLPARLRCPAVVVRTEPPDLGDVLDALRHGSNALLWGESLSRDLCAVLSLVSKGYFLMSAGYVGAPQWGGVAHRPISVPELTGRERDVLGCITGGHTIRQTARHLGISVKTVENTQARLFRKLGARNRSEALVIAYQMGELSSWNRESY